MHKCDILLFSFKFLNNQKFSLNVRTVKDYYSMEVQKNFIPNDNYTCIHYGIILKLNINLKIISEIYQVLFKNNIQF